MAQESPPLRAASEGEGDDRSDTPLNIAGAILTGIKWKVATQFVSEIVRVILAVVLARLLSPGNYGVAGIAIVCASFASSFVDPALGTALVQKRSLTETDRSTVFWTTLGLGMIFTVAGIAVSSEVADFFGQPEVRKLFMALSLTFVISAFAVTQTSLLIRELSYRSLEIREIAATVCGAVIALCVAFAGFGPWAIIANTLGFGVVSTALVWSFSPWRPHATFSRGSLRELGGFGIKVFASRLLSWGNGNADNVLIGRFLGAAPLGAYALAYNVMFVPMTRVGVPLQQVMSPAFARMQDDLERLEQLWLKSRRMSNTLLAPAFLICIVVAPEIVHTVFGQKWNAAVAPLQLLCIAGVAQSLVTFNWAILTACGKGGALLRVNLVVSVVTIAAFAAGVPFGIAGVAGFYAAAKWLLVLVDTWITTRAVSFGFWSSLVAGIGIIPIAAAAAAFGFGLRELLIAEHVGELLRLPIVGTASVLAYVGLLSLLQRSLFMEARLLLRPKTLKAAGDVG